jgi:hypothetical protein
LAPKLNGSPSTIALIAYIQSDLCFPFGLIDDPLRAREHIFGDYSTANVLAQLNLRPILTEFTSPNQNGAAPGLDGCAIPFFAAPLDERAI